MSIAAENLAWGVGRKTILNDVSLTVQPGTILGLLGPNGSGKSSLLRLLAGLVRPVSGRVTLDGQDIARMRRRDLARRIALVQQHAATEMNVTVQDVVMLGRIPHRAPLAGCSQADATAVDTALAQVDMTTFRHESWQSLSGGERQRVQIARALAQQPRELFLDEPTNHLDIQHQLDLLRLISTLGLTSIVALHDLNHAAMFCDRLLVLDGGRVVADGPPDEVLTAELLAGVFKVECDFHRTSDGRHHILFR
ncbi:ABC transporter ATP-binding protein [Paracoccus nototheniae]|uniref:ABC transporter ATP-binding protein n=1 Tax=Paracoccus nototheniae TaxID=2489002 RepID=A0ABW4DWT0_9RHOB|nr:ABC transporter ATP-binding protein [Paracoccus nototheniae]